MQLDNALTFSHTIIEQVVLPGDLVVDATVGQGNDTRFLAALVGKTGRVLGFDIQQTALDETRTMLTLTGLRQQVELIHAGHETLAQKLTATDQLSAVMFNLGYLPGGDHSVVTKAASTIAALQTACDNLRRSGVITLMVYTGHPGGEKEAAAVEQFVTGLPQKTFQVLRYQYINQQHQPPYLLIIQKR
ncbi:tRNA (mnm(5)s(2)U34)-methyltransferase [Furfurilactobacillus siliginis]|uniref:SAM-dependent methyltransferase n=1 Tax=Furfurilactobacillus siliginis TaxID=348151 RepID=A0A0R2KVY0_9LACO|nr:class I SAM-dependent methyltransferase [Furfurilactobacillus siliginis]KRN93672.1 SAM-dependent methyltransferase [Furfurilactobacillus siliginis]GEK28376.1 rRNA methyltransferase [Furfurilactobacillus siliginis]